MPTPSRVAEVFRSQHGVAHRTQLLEAGLTRSTLSRRSRSGHLERVHPSVYRLAGVPPSWESATMAAVLASGGVASHRAAARLWGYPDVWCRRPEITVPYRSRAELVGVDVHRSTQFDRIDRNLRLGIPTTGPLRTIVDVAAVVPYGVFEGVVDQCLARQDVSWNDLYELWRAHSRHGRDGCGPLHRLLDERFGDGAIPLSAWSRMALALLREAGLGGFELEYRIHDARGRFVAQVDLARPSERLVIELDSVRYHLNRPSFEHDAVRRNRLVAAGWRVLNVTWDEFSRHPERLVRTVRDVLAPGPSVHAHAHMRDGTQRDLPPWDL